MKEILHRQHKKINVDYFGIPKGIDLYGIVLVIRVIYNRMSCRLNDAVWAPCFWLPTADKSIRQLYYVYWSVGLDLDEMFLVAKVL